MLLVSHPLISSALSRQCSLEVWGRWRGGTKMKRNDASVIGATRCTYPGAPAGPVTCAGCCGVATLVKRPTLTTSAVGVPSAVVTLNIVPFFVAIASDCGVPVAVAVAAPCPPSAGCPPSSSDTTALRVLVKRPTLTTSAVGVPSAVVTLNIVPFLTFVALGCAIPAAAAAGPSPPSGSGPPSSSDAAALLVPGSAWGGGVSTTLKRPTCLVRKRPAETSTA